MTRIGGARIVVKSCPVLPGRIIEACVFWILAAIRGLRLYKTRQTNKELTPRPAYEKERYKFIIIIYQKSGNVN